MYEVVEAVAPQLPEGRPRYLMGVGTPEDLVECVARGVDMFDCVLPTRNGRNGQAFTSRGKLNIKNARWTTDPRPLDEECACAVCRRHSRAYLRHLYMTGEMLAAVLLSHHNLAFFLDTMRRVRQAIRSGEFTRFRREFLVGTGSGVEGAGDPFRARRPASGRPFPSRAACKACRASPEGPLAVPPRTRRSIPRAGGRQEN